jgi:hypothetical protein
MRNSVRRQSDDERSQIARQDLSRFRYHTGATLRPLGSGETCPVLFRDVGPRALARFLRGELRRLAGPMAPVLYLRTSAYEEPYIDYERTGRLVFLQSDGLGPWHAGVNHVLVASADHVVDPLAVGFVPGDMPLKVAEQILAGVREVEGLRETFGGRRYDDLRADCLASLERLEVECERVERLVEPIRRCLQSGDRHQVDDVCTWMQRCHVTEQDLCAAWHHLPPARREHLREVLAEFPGGRDDCEQIRVTSW